MASNRTSVTTLYAGSPDSSPASVPRMLSYTRTGDAADLQPDARSHTMAPTALEMTEVGRGVPEGEDFRRTQQQMDKKLKEEDQRRKKEEMDGHMEEKLLYGVEDNPPWYTCIMLGLQHYLMMVESTVSIPYLLTPLLCLPPHHAARALIASTIIFVSGIVTFVQTTFGVRLPIVQGGTHGFLGPILSILALLPCPPQAEIDGLTEDEFTQLWTLRMRNIQGAICVASIFQVVVGATGAIGGLLRWITPLVIAPTISLIGFSLYPIATSKCASNWGIASLTIVLLIVFSQYLGEVPMPVPVYRQGRWTVGRAYVFKLIPVVLAVGLAWATCWALTAAGLLPEGDAARTDARLAVVADAPWFRVPYPCQWGAPQVTLAGTVGVLAGVLASIVESIGDYYACARIAGAPPPPPHAINRGIFTEGVGTFLAGLYGTGSGTTSYSQNIGAVAVTKVGSRRVIQYAGVIMLLCGLMGKVGAVFIIIPEPIIGGIFVVVFSMITSVGLSALQHVVLSSPRNLFVLGFSVFTGLAVPMWVKQHPGSLRTGVAELDQLLLVLLSTSMFVGGCLGFLLDNTVPGTARERGVVQWRAQLQQSQQQPQQQSEASQCYDLPFGMSLLRRCAWAQRVPILPTFRGWGAPRGGGGQGA
ncbi:solute carrier family 23 member 1 [Hyalella azteca]|uniref:Solute carrier family 23 member 1 n=1 Tax=Hyalella azteca TaxID=294128 RepID=A0A979FSL7_HYAAZ|nr:solute carrier family 23 member 1 [Hyalella azteca]